MSEKQVFATGAVPPPECEWQMGKTVASIDFVRDAEAVIDDLRKKIDAIKTGEVVLYGDLTVRPFFESDWNKAQKEPDGLQDAKVWFGLEWVDGADIIGCGIDRSKNAIVAYVTSFSKISDEFDVPSHYKGYAVVVERINKPTAA